jgi:hypothetical protein
MVVLAACGSPSAPQSPGPSAATTSTPLPAPPPSPVVTHYTVSGRVTDEAGSPVAGAYVEVQYPPTPPRFGAYVATTSNASGLYELAFDTDRPIYAPGVSSTAGVINSSAAGYQPHSQLAPWGVPTTIRNLRLRAERTVRAGDSTSVSIVSDSSICYDWEDWFLPAQRCERFTVLVATSGTLTVAARDPGAVVPSVFSATTGSYQAQQRGDGGVSLLQVRAGERYQLFVGVPQGNVPQRYDVMTAVQ